MNIEQKKEQLKELLKIHYGFDKFRLGQEKAIDSILAGRDTLVIMPTGGGKSLIYQLPSLVLDGVTVVISPLISLMKDQVDSLERVGIPATFINSSISQAEVFNRLEKVKSGYYKILYIAPERFYNQEFVAALKAVKVSLFAVDEAHCISQWGHDFRPSYVRMKTALEMLGRPPVVALTATATLEVKQDIQKQLELKNPEVIVTGFARPNLQFGSVQTTEAQKPQLLVDAIKSTNNGSGVVYVSTRSKADSIAQILIESDIDAIVYHAGMDQDDRRWVQDKFMSGQAQVVVATNAFGLGIDKRDIRFVVHYDMPGTIEAYYQEAGRAGRDGAESMCLLLYSTRDRYLQEFFIKGDNPPPSAVVEIYETLLNFTDETILITYAELAKMITENIPEMAIGTALKILEKEGYITRPNEKTGSAWLQFNNSFAEVINSVGKRAKTQIEIINKLEEKFSKEILNGWQFVPEDIAELIGVKKEALMRMVRALSEKGMAEYKPPFKGTEIKILKRVDSTDLNLDFSALKEKLRKSYAKLDAMEDYIYHFDCRQKYILDYFGDMNSASCGKCDNCLSVKFGRNKKETVETYDRGDKPKSSLNTKLTQLETYDLFNKGESLKKIAEKRGMSDSTIEGHMVFLIEKKLIKDIDKLVDLENQEKIKKAIKKVGAEKLKPIFDELGESIDYAAIKFVLAKIKAEGKNF